MKKVIAILVLAGLAAMSFGASGEDVKATLLRTGNIKEVTPGGGITFDDAVVFAGGFTPGTSIYANITSTNNITAAKAIQAGTTIRANTDAVIGGTLTVSGAVSAASSVGVVGTLKVTGATTLGSTLVVTGAVDAVSSVAAASFKIGAIAGWSGIVTNTTDLEGTQTNLIYYSGGIVTNVIRLD